MIIDKPGMYRDLPEALYHADPAVRISFSRGFLWELLMKSPQHAHAGHPKLGGGTEHEGASVVDIAKAIHAGLTRSEAALHVINAKDYRTKDAQEQRAQAWEAGKIPLLAPQLADVRRAVDAAKRQIVAHEVAPFWREGDGEITGMWQETVNGVPLWFRIRVDWLPQGASVFFDVKTTQGTADPDTWSRRLFDGGYDFQEAFYRRGLRKLTNNRIKGGLFLVVEQTPPHAISVVGLDPASMAMADEKVQQAIELLAECVKADRWPGYPARICYAEAPPWEATKHEMRKERARHAREVGGGLTAGLIHWQAPKVAAE